MKNKGLIILLCVLLVLSLFSVSCSLFQKPEQPQEDEEERIEKDEDNEDTILTTDTPQPDDEQVQTEVPDYNYVPIPIGSFVLYGADGTDQYTEGDINIEIFDETTGSMYFFSEYDAYDFTYTYVDGKLTMNLDNGEIIVYEAMVTEVADLWLTDINNPDIRYYYYLDYEDIFTALGAWVIEYDDGSLGSISFWPDGRGYATNWQEVKGDLLVVEWWYSYGVLQVELHGVEKYYGEFFDEHRGNVLELSTYEDKLVHFRVKDELLLGYYFLQDSDAMDFEIMQLALYEDGSAMCVLNKGGIDTLYENENWEIDDESGKLIINLSGRDALQLDYFYTGYGLLLFDESTGYSYLLSEGLDPSGD